MCDWGINFCKNLCYLQQVHDLTKKEMAEILGVSASTYRKIERCEDSVRLHCGMVSRVQSYFQISADDLLMKDIEKETYLFYK